METALAGSAEQLAFHEKGLLKGDNPSAACAALQGVVKPWTAGRDMRLMSIRTLPPAAKGPYSEVAVQVDIQTTTEGLTSFLAQIPRHPLLLRVRKFSVRSGAFSRASAGSKETLSATIVVAGMTAAKDESTAGGKR